MIRRCTADDLDAMGVIINDAAQAYRGVIPADCWHEPYLPRANAFERAHGSHWELSFRACEESQTCFERIPEIPRKLGMTGVFKCNHPAYMPLAELTREIEAGVVFWGWEADGELVGVMGIQDKGEVTLIRHAYVRTARRNAGVGTQLLRHLERQTTKPILIGTWTAATWAIRFYEKNGYRCLSRADTERLLRRYWNIPGRQVVTSVVLANAAWL